MGGSIQNTYGKREKGYKGGIANSNPTTLKDGVASVDLSVGKFCAVGATGFEVLTASNTLAGVVVKSSAFVADIIKAGKSTTVAKRGSIFVYCETVCTEGKEVFVRHTANGALEIGNVRNDADTSKAVQVKATFAETLDSAGLVEIELNL